MSELPSRSDQANQSAERTVLPYQSLGPGDAIRRPSWVFLIVAIYLAVLAALPIVPWWLEWSLGSMDASAVAWLSAVISIFIACGLAMMVVPVQVRRRRPMTRRSIWIPILASGFLAAATLFGAALAFTEFVTPYCPQADAPSTGWAVVAASVSLWIGWAVLFGLMVRRRDPSGIGLMLHRCLIAGSILELLVAVPCHIIVRRRGDCCGGIATGIGICIGTAVALIAFGPSVFLLYYRRSKLIQQKPAATH